ncbi:hypothetical protein EVAR_19678_1 [Eumeta japonica]|uniref:Uncharacterized protein n=1 Tax=Eumeta variegata TaxID=151549 RepID=A0A4C1V3A2_EUMVA|nr:hypothetical protein EVAR_19678_1 [Eumeta japonica]
MLLSRREQAYRVLRQMVMTSQMAEIFTEHGECAKYLHRFKLKNSPYCACDPSKIQDVLYVLEEYPTFFWERVALEAEIDVIVGRRVLPMLMNDDKPRQTFLKFCYMVVN